MSSIIQQSDSQQAEFKVEKTFNEENKNQKILIGRKLHNSTNDEQIINAVEIASIEDVNNSKFQKKSISVSNEHINQSTASINSSVNMNLTSQRKNPIVDCFSCTIL